MPRDGVTLTMTEITAPMMTNRALVFHQTHPTSGGDPTGPVWTWAWANVPFYHFQNPRARRLDFDTPAGRMDPEIRMGQHVFYFPLDLTIFEDDWVRDVTVKKNGAKGRNYGHWFVVRMKPRFFDPPEGMEAAAHLVVGVSPDETPSPRLLAAGPEL